MWEKKQTEYARSNIRYNNCSALRETIRMHIKKIHLTESDIDTFFFYDGEGGDDLEVPKINSKNMGELNTSFFSKCEKKHQSSALNSMYKFLNRPSVDIRKLDH